MRHFSFGIEGYVDFVRSLGMRQAIVLRRRNLLRRFVSNKLARESGSYQLRRGEKAALPRIRLDVDRIGFGPGSYRLLDAIRLVEDEYARLERQGPAVDPLVSRLDVDSLKPQMVASLIERDRRIPLDVVLVGQVQPLDAVPRER